VQLAAAIAVSSWGFPAAPSRQLQSARLIHGKQRTRTHGIASHVHHALRAGSVIKGWDEGVATMKKGEKVSYIVQTTLQQPHCF